MFFHHADDMWSGMGWKKPKTTYPQRVDHGTIDANAALGHHLQIAHVKL